MLGFGILDYIKLGVGVAVGALIAAAVAYPLGHWRGVNDGRELERAAAIQRSMEIIQERSDTNAKVNDLDDPGLCAALGGEWVPDQDICK